MVKRLQLASLYVLECITYLVLLIPNVVCILLFNRVVDSALLYYIPYKRLKIGMEMNREHKSRHILIDNCWAFIKSKTNKKWGKDIVIQ